MHALMLGSIRILVNSVVIALLFPQSPQSLPQEVQYSHALLSQESCRNMTRLLNPSVVFQSERVTPLPEVAYQATNTQRTAEPLIDIPALARVISSGLERRNYCTRPPRGQSCFFLDALNGKYCHKLGPNASLLIENMPKLDLRKNCIDN